MCGKRKSEKGIQRQFPILKMLKLLKNSFARQIDLSFENSFSSQK